MTAVAGHVGVTDVGMVGEERVDEVAGLFRGKEPVAGIADDEPWAGSGAQGDGEIAG